MAKPHVTSGFVPALLVIDMQYDFVHGSLVVPDAVSIIDIINSHLSSPFTTKIGTKDFHPANHISFAATHNLPVYSVIKVYPPGDDSGDRVLDQVLWPVHCVASTPGSEFVDGLHHDVLDAVVHKGTNPGIESYSAFRDPWHISNTELPKLLEASGVTDVFIVGVAGDYCVKCTAIDAVEFGYKTWVIKDAVKSVGDTGAEWEEMKSKGVHVITSVQAKNKLSDQGHVV